MSVIVLPTTRTLGSPRLPRSTSTAEPVDELAPEGAVVRPVEKLGASPMGRAVGCKRRRAPLPCGADDEERIVVHTHQDRRLGLRFQTVVAEEVRPFRWDVSQDVVI